MTGGANPVEDDDGVSAVEPEFGREVARGKKGKKRTCVEFYNSKDLAFLLLC
jgi:hypothetical protein